MTEYQVVYARATYELTEKVDLRLKMGWTTAGGIAVGTGPMHEGYYQAMIREIPELNERPKPTPKSSEETTI